MAAVAAQPVPGEIAPERLYSKDEILARLRWRKHAWASALKAGLVTKKAGRRVYVVGRDVIEFIANQ